MNKPDLTAEALAPSVEASSKAGTALASDTTSRTGKSTTSKINRYKKFERELEKHRAALEAMDKLARQREQSKNAAADHREQEKARQQATIEK